MPKDTTKRRPWFPFYVEDFRSDRNVQEMTKAEVGIYLFLLMAQWQEGSIPAEPERIARVVGEPIAVLKRAWKNLARCFVPHPSEPERLVNPRLERERARTEEVVKKRSLAGSLGNAKRWQTDRTCDTDAIPNGSQEDRICDADAMANGSQTDRICDTDAIPNGSQSYPHTHIDSSPIGEPAPNGAACHRSIDSSAEEGSNPRAHDAHTFTLSSDQESSPPKTSKRMPTQRSLEDIAAHQILDVAWPVIAHHHGRDLTITHADWRKRNKAAALSLYRAGISSDQVTAALKCAFTHPVAAPRYGGTIFLAKLQEIIPVLRRILSGEDGAYPARQRPERPTTAREVR